MLSAIFVLFFFLFSTFSFAQMPAVNTAVPGSDGQCLTNSSGTISATACGGASTSYWTITTYMNTATAADVYVVVGGGTSNATENNIDVSVIPVNMNCQNLRVQMTNAPGGAATWDVTLRTGAVGALAATTLTCQVTSAVTACSDTTHAPALTAGNVWTYHMDATGSVASTGVYSIAMECYK